MILRSIVRLMLAVTVVVHTVPAQPRTADPIKRGLQLSDFPRLVPLADGVYGYEDIRAPGFTTVSLIVIGQNGVLIADGQGNARAMQAMLERIRTLTPLPVRWYVVGSDHGDHTGGNSVLPKDIRFFVHPTSRAQLVRDSTAAQAANQRSAMDSAAKGAPAPEPRVVVVPPAAMTSDRETVDIGGRTVEVLFLGRAHTGGDLMVYVPRAKILFMSEVYLNRVFPAMRSAYPTDWMQTIDRALAMDVRRFVPGHGFVEEPDVSREELVAFRQALASVTAEARRLHGLGLSADDAIKQAQWGEYANWFLVDQQGPIAIRRVYDDIEGRIR